MQFRNFKQPRYLIVILILSLCFFKTKAQIMLEPHPIFLDNGVKLDLKIPRGYHIVVSAQGMHRLRFLAKSPDGRLFCTDMHSLADNKQGRIYLFEDWDNISKKFNKTTIFADGLHNPNQVMFYEDKGKNYMYVAETDKLSRYEYHAGDKTLQGPGQVLAHFPAYGLSYKYGGWHLTRSLAQHNGKIYVSVGSSCNACAEHEDVRATIMEMNPDGSGQHIYATGIRNAVAIKWVNDKLWATCMSRDLLGPDKPEDLFEVIEQNKNYGWPWYIQYQQKMYPDTKMTDSAKLHHIIIPPPPPLAYCGFKAHSAPLGFDYFANFGDPVLKNKFLVALHGSTMISRERGNAIVMINGRDQYVDVVDGFQTGKLDKDRHGRACDVMMKDSTSFFITDDKNGALYYVWKP